MDKNLALYRRTAYSLNLPHSYLPLLGFLRVTLGKKNYYFKSGLNPLNTGASIQLANNKYHLNRQLARAGFPVANSIDLNKEQWQKEALSESIRELRFPLVVKPTEGTSCGKDVMCKIGNIDLLTKHLKQFFQTYNHAHIEEFHEGLNEYRILMLNHRVIGVAKRSGASVIGNGTDSIEQLIAQKNLERAKLIDTISLSPLKMDEEYKNCLLEQNVNLQTVPAMGMKIRLCYTANSSRGGDILPLGRKVHPSNARYLSKVTKALGLKCVGFDLLCEEIYHPFNQDKLIIIEANTVPDLTIHETPIPEGKPHMVVDKILKQLIYRHPLSYLYHLTFRSRIAPYIKSALILTLVIAILKSL